MSRKLKYFQAFNELVTNALLALCCSIKNDGGYWTVKKRNEYLVKFIKPKVKQTQFANCKKEIKTMLSIGRHAGGNLEQRLWEMNDVNLSYQARFSQADELYIMLTDIFEQHQFPSMLENTNEAMEVDTLYMTQEEIEKGFDAENIQIKPLAMTVKTHRLKALIDSVQSKGTYRVEVDFVDEHEVIHLLLHRKE